VKREATISTDRVFSGKLINLRVDTVSLPNDRVARREIVEHPGAVALLPLDAEGKVVMVKQYRKAAEQTLLEIPAGTLHRGEEPLVAAQRELQEEIGAAAEKLEHLIDFYPSPGFSSEVTHLYVASGLRPSSLPADEDESFEIVHLSLDEAIRMVREGEIRDAKSIIGLLMYECLRRSPSPEKGQ